MVLTVFFSFLINLALIQGRPEVEIGPGFRPDNYTHFDVYASALSRAHYNPWVCDYRSEPGYKCLSCSSALHCYPGNFALLVQCAGMFPFCRNGYCSRFKTEGCIQEADPSLDSHSTMPPMPPFVQVFNRVNKTTMAPPSHAITEPVLHDPVPQESASKPGAKPNKIKGKIEEPITAEMQPNNDPHVKESSEEPKL